MNKASAASTAANTTINSPTGPGRVGGLSVDVSEHGSDENLAAAEQGESASGAQTPTTPATPAGRLRGATTVANGTNSRPVSSITTKTTASGANTDDSKKKKKLTPLKKPVADKDKKEEEEDDGEITYDSVHQDKRRSLLKRASTYRKASEGADDMDADGGETRNLVSALLAAELSTRSAIFLLIPFGGLITTYVSSTAGYPIFCRKAKNLSKMLPGLLIFNARHLASIRVKRMGSHAEWKVGLMAFIIFMTESRLINYMYQLMCYCMSISMIFYPIKRFLYIGAVIVVLRCLISCLSVIIILANMMGVQDDSDANAGSGKEGDSSHGSVYGVNSVNYGTYSTHGNVSNPPTPRTAPGTNSSRWWSVSLSRGGKEGDKKDKNKKKGKKGEAVVDPYADSDGVGLSLPSEQDDKSIYPALAGPPPALHLLTAGDNEEGSDNSGSEREDGKDNEGDSPVGDMLGRHNSRRPLPDTVSTRSGGKYTIVGDGSNVNSDDEGGEEDDIVSFDGDSERYAREEGAKEEQRYQESEEEEEEESDCDHHSHGHHEDSDESEDEEMAGSHNRHRPLPPPTGMTMDRGEDTDHNHKDENKNVGHDNGHKKDKEEGGAARPPAAAAAPHSSAQPPQKQPGLLTRLFSGRLTSSNSIKLGSNASNSTNSNSNKKSLTPKHSGSNLNNLMPLSSTSTSGKHNVAPPLPTPSTTAVESSNTNNNDIEEQEQEENTVENNTNNTTNNNDSTALPLAPPPPRASSAHSSEDLFSPVTHLSDSEHEVEAEEKEDADEGEGEKT